jgi:hypothetical protein
MASKCLLLFYCLIQYTKLILPHHPEKNSRVSFAINSCLKIITLLVAKCHQFLPKYPHIETKYKLMSTYVLNISLIIHLTDEQFYQLCTANKDLNLELTATG